MALRYSSLQLRQLIPQIPPSTELITTLKMSLNQTTSAVYSYLDNPRSEGRGGGIAAIYQQDLQPRPLTIPAAPSFEHLAFKLPGPKPLIIAII